MFLFLKINGEYYAIKLQTYIKLITNLEQNIFIYLYTNRQVCYMKIGQLNIMSVN